MVKRKCVHSMQMTSPFPWFLSLPDDVYIINKETRWEQGGQGETQCWTKPGLHCTHLALYGITYAILAFACDCSWWMKTC